MDFYVYYRVQTQHAEQLQQRVAAMQRQLSSQYGISAALKRRPGSADPWQTWMEVYPAAPPDFASGLALAAQQAELAALIAGPRHIETFMDVLPCA